MSYWTEEQIARAAKIWNDGGSATNIGNALGCGRGADVFARQRRPGWDSWGNELDKFGEGQR